MNTELMILLIAMVAVIAVVIIYYIAKTIKKATKELLGDIFVDKDLEIKTVIPITEKNTIKLYELKLKENSRELDDYDPSYLTIAQIINRHINFVMKSDEIEIVTPDFSSEEFHVEFTEMMEAMTNFRLSQFRFKKGNGKNKLFALGNEKIDTMVEHTEDIISQVFNHMYETKYIHQLEEIIMNNLLGQ